MKKGYAEGVPAPTLQQESVNFTLWTWFVFGAWLVLSAGLTLYNKWLFDAQCPFPILVTLSHQVLGFVIRVVYMFVPHPEGYNMDFGRTFWKFLFLSIFFAVTIAFNNLSLLYIHVSTNTIIKCFTPVIQVFISKALESKVYNWKVYGIIGIIVVGCIMALWSVPDFHLLGYLLAVGSAVALALQNSVSAILLQDLKVHVIGTWLNQSFFSTPMLLIGFFIKEMDEFDDFIKNKADDMLPLWLLCGMVMALCFNLVYFSLVKCTTSVYAAVGGVIKTVMLIVISMIIWNIEKVAINYVGLAVVIVAFGFFNIAMKSKKTVEKTVEYEPVSVYSDEEGGYAAAKPIRY